MTDKELLEVEPQVHCGGTLVSIDQVKPNPLNPNQHPADQLEMMAVILRRHGWREAITVSKRSGFVVRGHGRLACAKLMGLKAVPVEHQDYVSEESELADLVADNRIAQHSFVDALALGRVLHKLGEGDRKATGYSDDETGLLLAAEFVPAKPDENYKAPPTERVALYRDEKEVLVRAIQKWCLKNGKELRPGEVLVAICREWAGDQLAPVKEKEPEMSKAKEVEAKPFVPAPDGGLLSAPSTYEFKVKSVAKTEKDGKEVAVVRPVKGEVKFYCDLPELEVLCRAASGTDKVLDGEVEDRAGALWLIKVRGVENV